MDSLILGIGRFRNNKKEAISKNFINLAECFSRKNIAVISVSPTSFDTDCDIEQHNFRKHSRYNSLIEGVINLVKTCSTINKIATSRPYPQINIHIATPIELLIVYIFIDSKLRHRTTISVWQSFLTYSELKENYKFFLRNIVAYLHIILFNSYISSVIYKRILHHFKNIIVHSRFQKNQLESISKSNINFIQNGVFPISDTPIKQSDDNHFVLAYIGHAKHSKGVDYLIELIYKLKKRSNINFKFNLCLSGFGDSEKITKRIDNLNLNDVIKYKEDIDVGAELAVTDLLILPLRTCVGTSLTPNIIVESLSIGTPVAIPRFPELCDTIKFGKNSIEIFLNNLDESALAIENFHMNQSYNKMFLHEDSTNNGILSLEVFINGYHNILSDKWSSNE
ncbi:glycosyltransferase [Vibrio breoganii]|uniref:glycosyltransferase n=1 Tax=Vibrio breoganii TaxID=553239 RepID=UPI0021C39D13|nr:glycosyltransferase [Vibrio breoganii]MDN3717480.1 glycosyltransferase [Vibrio breoganii]